MHIAFAVANKMDYLVTWNCAHLANGETIRRLANKRLLVGFASGVTKIYDCTPLLKHEPFKPLSNDAVFRSVHADPHGYGVVWTDDLDLAESELWLNGEVVEPGDPVDH